MNDRSSFPGYSYVPGLFPHPHSHPQGHRFGPPFPPTNIENLADDPTFQQGISLFNAGYYWESHEAWEHLWHAAGRRGPVADLLKALIQLAVVGVKIREGRPDGARTHARRAHELFRGLDANACPIDVPRLATFAAELENSPPPTPTEPRHPVEIVFPWKIV